MKKFSSYYTYNAKVLLNQQNRLSLHIESVLLEDYNEGRKKVFFFLA
ncbi:hypothetical protein NT05LM_2530 [Listeria marthii FSL S4-120]|uniref:Uncharacterized protein n=1 Tax=Listeria marthii FSL S4-120 TaxID=702457 RepID=A0ABP2JVN8_9LIST|nr:hypothetical protein NT05LM_2530 [Listeria marthii FSL S4-120]